jgi:hypothetical protein
LHKEGGQLVKWARINTAKANHGTLDDAGALGGISFNCIPGMDSSNALKLADEKNINGKFLIDLANSLDFTRRTRPSLNVYNTDLADISERESCEKLLTPSTVNSW